MKKKKNEALEKIPPTPQKYTTGTTTFHIQARKVCYGFHGESFHTTKLFEILTDFFKKKISRF